MNVWWGASALADQIQMNLTFTTPVFRSTISLIRRFKPKRNKRCGASIRTAFGAVLGFAGTSHKTHSVWRASVCSIFQDARTIGTRGDARQEVMGTYRGSLLAVDGGFLCLGEMGHLLWMDLTPRGYKEVSARMAVRGARVLGASRA